MPKRVRTIDPQDSSQKENSVDKNQSSHTTDSNIDQGQSDDQRSSEEEEEEEEDQQYQIKKNTHSNKKQKLSSNDIQVARETAELFKSNIFKLQIDELIKELKLKDSHCKLIEKVLHKLHNVIEQIPDSLPLPFEQAQNYFTENKSQIKIPFPDPKPNNLNYNLQYSPPDDISLIGSFGLKTGIQQKNGMSIDVSLTMPKSLIQPKDYLNYRIIYKQAFYLAYLTHHISVLGPRNNLNIKLSYDYHNGDRLCPSLIIESNNSSKNSNDLLFHKTNFKIRLLVGLPFGVFDNKKLLPDKNSIRIQNSSINSIAELPPTPLYNSSILKSSTYSYYLKYLYTNKKSTEAFKDASNLGKLWLYQRGFSSNVNDGGFGNFEFNILMSALLNGGGINGNKILLHGYSSYQLFKGTIKYLATMDLCDDGYLSFNSSLINDENFNSVYKKNTGFNIPTIFDKNTKLNLLWKMTKSSYLILKKFANETLVLLNDLVIDRFNQIFLSNNRNHFFKYDSLISIPFNKLLEFNKDNFNSLEKISFLNFENFMINKIYKLLSQALDDRVYQIDIKLLHNLNSWSISNRKPSTDKNQQLLIGLYLNPLESDKRITKGPLNHEKDLVEKFISFWGEDKAQLRKYKDNSIQWSCLWENNSNDSIVLMIIKFVLDKYLSNSNNLLSNYLVINSTKFNSLLPSPLNSTLINSQQPLILPDNFIQLKKSFDSISKILTNLDLPLRIRNVLPNSPSLRNTSIILPVPFATCNPDFFNSCIIQFETSSKWPIEINSLEDMKSAFLIKILNELISNDLVKDCYMIEDNSITYNSNIKSLRVLTHEGYGYQFKVLTEIDELLYLNAIENANKLNNNVVKNEMELTYIKFMKNYVKSIKHHRNLSILVTHFPYYSSIVRFFKLWLDSQMILVHLNDELIELIVLKVFIDPSPYSLPNSVMTGFLRILKFLSNWNWIEDPLILDLSREFNKKYNENTDSYVDKISDKLDLSSYESINHSFKRLREKDPKGLKTPFFIGTKDDLSGKVFSHGISIVIASRLTSLSRVILSLISKIDDYKLDDKFMKLIFKPALKDYDVLIKLDLDSKSLKRYSGILPNNIKFKNLIEPLTKYRDDYLADLNPALNFHKELVSRFGEVIVWSVQKYQGVNDTNECYITGLIIPGNDVRKFRVNIGYPFKLIEGNEGKVSLDVDDILKNIAILGKDLVKSVEKKKQ